jgi:HD superfamily phosphohydrolase
MTELQDFAAAIRAWTDELIEPYLERLGGLKDGARQRSKEFNDGVWSTVTLRPIEVLILDSPLLQRLRHIRQLGVVHLVYPGATHTRIDHTIGTVHQVSRLVNAINESDEAIDGPMVNLLRMAALCHDIGHGVMSHVSENALSEYRSTRLVTKEFWREQSRERGSASEIAAFYMISSDGFCRLLAESQRITEDHDLPQDPIELMKKAVVGQQISNKIPLLHELISGPFDADKLDYMTRDARMTGVPVVTDIPRLVQKVRGRRLPLAKLPSELKEQVYEEDGGYTLTGISLSGGRTLDELMFGHMLLRDKLYRHQKVRAAESMVASIFDQIEKMCPSGELMAPYGLLDDELLHLRRETLARLAGRRLNEQEETRARVAVDISERLAIRHLFRRAYAFAQNMPLDPYRMDQEHDLGLKILVSSTRNASDRERLMSRIIDETTVVLDALGNADVRDRYPGGDISPYIRINPPRSATKGNETARAYLINDSDTGPPVIRFKEEYAETTGWSNAYLLTRDTGYIFSTEDLALPVFLAAEKIARVDFDVRTPKSMFAYAKHDRMGLVEAKRKLEKAGFYEGIPHDLRPLPDEFERGNYRDRVGAVTSRLAGYQGPVVEGQESKEGTVMSSERIETWAIQFGSHADDALGLAEQIKMVGRKAIVDAVREFVASDAGAEFGGASVTPLGDAKDSSALTTYFAGDHPSLRIRNLAEALRNEAPIIFAEDFVGRGSQTISILESWLGRTLSQDLHEERGDPLPPELQEALKNRPLALVYATGSPEGAQAVEATAAEMDLSVKVHLSDDSAPVAFAGPETEFEVRCREVGRQLLEDDRSDHDEAWIEQRALGYGNEAFLVVLSHNTPTQALTCLWKEGEVDGVPWVPLVPRRPKL